ncbi:MAG: pyrroline-5-carboxylate reductase [Lachnospiraceae bacterium]|jgi:pyrroline-5-carboxylate reductase|nr:pyrroline-5-carboxylate reductase [Lachnospiraceae bacterium]
MEIGFIGMGNMGYAMLKGVLQYFPESEIIFSDTNKERCEKISAETNVEHADSNAECANKAKYVIFAVKPQYYKPMLESVENVISSDNVIISIAPGITIDDIKNKLGDDKRIVRAMPNTPALLGAGMTGICYDNKLFDEDEIEVIDKIFSSFGRYRKVEERLMSAVTCVSGSSPAYVYMFIDALADGAVKYGLPRDAALEMAAQAVYGSAKMVLETGEHPGKLKDMVCSPGGTTIAGVSALEEFGFRNSIIKATDECFKKSEGIK